MPVPKNPDTIIVKNEYYPHGLREIDIWSHYHELKTKYKILNGTRGREIMFFLATDLNKTIVLRNMDKKPIRMTALNYDFLIGGRTLSIHATMNKTQDFGIVDVDVNMNEFQKAKEITFNAARFLERASFIDNVIIRFTGKSSFHIVCFYKKPLDVDRGKLILKNYLVEGNIIEPSEDDEEDSEDYEYTIRHQSIPNIPNLDLAPNKLKGAYIIEGSLSVIGLECMNVDIKRLKYFRKEQAIIKTKK
jgi:hypothetical protein